MRNSGTKMNYSNQPTNWTFNELTIDNQLAYVCILSLALQYKTFTASYPSYLSWNWKFLECLSLLSFYCWSKTTIAPYKSTLSLVSTYHLNMTNLSTKPNNIKKTFSKLHITLPQKTYQLTINVEFALKSCFSFHIFYADSFLPQMYYASVSQYFLT